MSERRQSVDLSRFKSVSEVTRGRNPWFVSITKNGQFSFNSAVAKELPKEPGYVRVFVDDTAEELLIVFTKYKVGSDYTLRRYPHSAGFTSIDLKRILKLPTGRFPVKPADPIRDESGQHFAVIVSYDEDNPQWHE